MIFGLNWRLIENENDIIHHIFIVDFPCKHKTKLDQVHKLRKKLSQ